jgi:NAD/NADP transhydrogenase beta subunit
MIYDTSQELEKKKYLAQAIYLAEKGFVVDLTRKLEKRTVTQNSYLHAIIQMFAIHTTNNLDDTKQLLKRACHFMHTFDGENIKTKRTRDLDTKQMTDFIEWIRTFAGMQGCYIPTADEYKLNKFAIDSEIEKFKEYL